MPSRWALTTSSPAIPGLGAQRRSGFPPSACPLTLRAQRTRVFGHGLLPAGDAMLGRDAAAGRGDLTHVARVCSARPGPAVPSSPTRPRCRPAGSSPRTTAARPTQPVGRSCTAGAGADADARLPVVSGACRNTPAPVSECDPTGTNCVYVSGSDDDIAGAQRVAEVRTARRVRPPICLHDATRVPAAGPSDLCYRRHHLFGGLRPPQPRPAGRAGQARQRRCVRCALPSSPLVKAAAV